MKYNFDRQMAASYQVSGALLSRLMIPQLLAAALDMGTYAKLARRTPEHVLAQAS